MARRKVKKKKRKRKLGEYKGRSDEGSKAKKWRQTRRDLEGAKRVNKKKKGGETGECWQRDRREKQSPVHYIGEAVGYASYLYRGLQIGREWKERKGKKKKKKKRKAENLGSISNI